MMQRKVRIELDGVLFLDKPQGLSSNAALQRVRNIFNAKKAGHTGTLDPMATGLLPLTFGEATKFSQTLLDADKTYEAQIALGAETDSGDAEGELMSQQPVAGLGDAEIDTVLQEFSGDIMQIPPMFSALKHNGKPLYHYARAGQHIDREARAVTVYWLERLGTLDEHNRFWVRVRCSKGTYIRVLAVDIGRRLGCGAHLTALRRTGVGLFSVAQAVTIDRLTGTEAQQWLAPVDTFLWSLPRIDLDSAAASQLMHGQSVVVSGGCVGGACRLYQAQRFLGVGRINEEGVLVPVRLVHCSGQNTKNH